MSSSKLTSLELAKKQVQIEIIRSCIIKSKSIIMANAAKQALRNAKFFIVRLPYLLPSEGEIKSINDELDNKIFELKRHISISLNNLTTGRPNITIEPLFWFSLADLKSGYILLYPHSFTKFADNVLFLVETYDPIDNGRYFPGDIYPFRQVNHVLSTMKGLSDKELGIGFKYATSYEILKELSNLQSSIKSKNYERDIIP